MTNLNQQYEYSAEKITEAQNSFTLFATPDLSDITIENGFCPIIAARFEDTFAVVETTVYPVSAPQARRPMLVTLLTAIINIIS